MKICVFAASSDKVDKSYFNATEKLALEFVKNNIDIVYGGGAYGLMGKLADVVIQNGGKIQGIIPKFMLDVEWGHKLVTDMILVETMAERKAKFLEGIDAIVSLPGGCGTFEELLEAITLKRLGQFTKPIIILNTNEYYNPLKEMLERSIQENFMNTRHRDIWSFVDEPKEVIPAILNAPIWDKDAIKFAAVE
jgi:uncharacterized protein (TIGR00730 family)